MLTGRALLERKTVQILGCPDRSGIQAEQSCQSLAVIAAMIGTPAAARGSPDWRVRLVAQHRASVQRQADRAAQTFADQAVIAIENVRLFDEVQAKTRDWRRR